MELRAFGTGPRTWSYQLIMNPVDYVLLVLSIGTLVCVTVLHLFVPAFSALWVPPLLIGGIPAPT